MGSGCGSVGRTVASGTGDHRFESRHWQILPTKCTLEKRKMKEKQAENGQSSKKTLIKPIDLNNTSINSNGLFHHILIISCASSGLNQKCYFTDKSKTPMS